MNPSIAASDAAQTSETKAGDDGRKEKPSAIIPIATSLTGISRPSRASLDDRVKDAIELSNYAITALKYNDVALAKRRLEEALKALG